MDILSQSIAWQHPSGKKQNNWRLLGVVPVIRSTCTMSTPREIELKLEVPAQSIARLTRSSLLNGVTAAALKPATLVSVYFDTKKLKLRRHGLSLRVRHIGPRHVQTIKQDGGEGTTLLARNEWEQEINGRRPDFDAARDTALEPLIGKKLRRRLLPL